jgi:outer membrane protein assembly factor BamB
VIVSPGGEKAGIVALNKLTGETVWVCSETQHKAGYCSPILVDYQGLRQIVTFTAKSAVGVHAATGKLLWQVERVTPYDENIPTPLFHDGCVFLTTGHKVGGMLLKLNVRSPLAPRGDSPPAERDAHMRNQTCSVDVLWRNEDIDNHHGGVILHDGHLYGFSHGKYKWGLACANWKTGATAWRVRTPTEGSLAFADGLLYSLTENGVMSLERPNPARREVVGSFHIPKGGQGPTWAHPVVLGGRLYVRHSDFLYCYDVKGK